jgi:hypothetical protein
VLEVGAVVAGGDDQQRPLSVGEGHHPVEQLPVERTETLSRNGIRAQREVRGVGVDRDAVDDGRDDIPERREGSGEDPEVDDLRPRCGSDDARSVVLGRDRPGDVGAVVVEQRPGPVAVTREVHRERLVDLQVRVVGVDAVVDDRDAGALAPDPLLVVDRPDVLVLLVPLQVVEVVAVSARRQVEHVLSVGQFVRRVGFFQFHLHVDLVVCDLVRAFDVVLAAPDDGEVHPRHLVDHLEVARDRPAVGLDDVPVGRLRGGDLCSECNTPQQCAAALQERSSGTVRHRDGLLV